MQIVLEMAFLTFGNMNIQFAEKTLVWKTYTVLEVLFTTKIVELIDKKDFAKAKLDKMSRLLIST